MRRDPERDAFRASMRELAQDQVAPIADEIDRTDTLPTQLVDRFRDLGLIQLAIPVEFGGPGGDVTAVCIAREEVARAGSMAVATLAGQNNALGLPLLQLGSDEQKARLLPELAKAGLPLLSEKPIAGSIAVAEKIVRALDENKTWLMVGNHKRSDPATIYAKAEIDRLKASGELGRLRYVRITMPPGDWIAGGYNDNVNTTEKIETLEWDPAPIDMDKATYEQYVAFVNFYIHQVNLLRHLLGEDYRVTYADPAQVLLVAQSESGVSGVIEMAPYNSTIAWQEEALVAFEKGYVKIQLPAPLVCHLPGKVEIFKDPGNGATPLTITPDLPPVHAMRNQALNFIQAVRGEAPAPCLAPEALKDLRVARDYIRLWKGV